MNLSLDALLFGWREGRHEAYRQDTVDNHPLGIARMQVGKALLAEGTKSVSGKLGTPFLAVVAGSIALKALHEPGKGCDPLHIVVTNVPDQTQSAARLKHAMDFMQRCGRGKPMKA